MQRRESSREPEQHLFARESEKWLTQLVSPIGEWHEIFPLYQLYPDTAGEFALSDKG